MKVRLQYRFLLKMLAVIAVIALVVAGVHRWQVYRNASSFLNQARKSVESGDRIGAIRFYTQYLGLNKDSAEAQSELGELFLQLGKLDQAYFHLEGALRLDPTLQKARESLVKVSMNMGRAADAKTYLTKDLIPAKPKNAEYHWLLGLCEQKLGEYQVALEHFKRAVELDERKPEYSASLAMLLSERLIRSKEARAILDQLVAKSSNDPESHLTRGQWLLSQSRLLSAGDNAVRQQLLEDAWLDAQSATRLAPDSPESVIFLVAVAVTSQRAAEARDVLLSAIAAHPHVPQLYSSAAQIELSNRNLEAAIQVLKDGLKAVPGSPAMLFDLTQLELDSGDIKSAQELIAELRSRKFDEAPIRYLESRVLAANGQWRQAATLLEQSRAQFDRSKELLKQVDFLLSACYRNLGNPDQELETLRRAISADPLWPEARAALASALARSGRVQEAMTEFTRLVQQPKPLASSWLSLARLMFLDGLRRNAKGDDWTALRQVLTNLDSIPEAANDLAIMRAELLVVENQLDEAETLLKSRLEVDPAVAALHQALISLQIRGEAWEKVEDSLNTSQQALSDSATIRLERARYLIVRNGKQVDLDQLEQLAVPNKDWDAAQQTQLATGFANYFLSLEDYVRGQKYASLVADSAMGKTNLSTLSLLFELASRSGDLAAMARTLETVKQIEGSGPLWRVGEAMRLSVEAKNTKESQTAERDALYSKAIGQLTEAAVLRPAWTRIPRLKGEILERQNRSDLATQAYLEAIELGERNPQLVSRTVYLLYQQGRFVQADEVVRKLQEQKSPFSSDLTRLASQVSLELENFDRALSLANDWAVQSGKQEDHLWLAQVLSISGDTTKAEKEFRIAIDKNRAVPGPWVSLVQMFARKGNTEAAMLVIAEAAQEIRPEDRDDALAQAYQSIRDFTMAEQFYQQAMSQHPDDPALMRRFADFCLSTGQPDLAEPILAALISETSTANELDQAWARRSLALVSFRGTDETIQKARELLDTNTKKFGPSAMDQRTMAVILASRPDPQSRSEAIKSLEQLIKQEAKFSLTDNYLLGRLYLLDGDWSRYSRTMRSVLGNGGAADSQYVRSYAEALVAKGELADGQLWFDRLKKLAPKDASTDTVEAQLLYASGDYARFTKLLESRGKEADRLEWAAGISEKTGSELKRAGKTDPAQKLLALAESLYSQIAATVPSRNLATAAFYARRGQIDQTLKLLDRAELPPDQVGQLAQDALQSGGLQATDARNLIGILQTVQAKHPKDIVINMLLGDLWSWIGEAQEAVGAYDRVIQVEPNNIPAHNNSAMVLGMTGQQLVDAKRLIEHAISVAGPVYYLLDTRGSVRFATGDVQGAEQDFRLAIQKTPRPDTYFHLAQALAAQNRQDEARAAMQKAKEDGATMELMHPLERKAFAALAKQY